MNRNLFQVTASKTKAMRAGNVSRNQVKPSFGLMADQIKTPVKIASQVMVFAFNISVVPPVWIEGNDSVAAHYGFHFRVG